MPICLTPGHLSRGIACNKKALRWPELTQVVHRRFPTHARAVQRSLEDLKELQSILQEWASMLHRPAAPLVLRTAFRMALAFRFSRELDSLALGSPKWLLRQAFPEGVSQLEFHKWYVVGWHEKNLGSHYLD